MPVKLSSNMKILLGFVTFRLFNLFLVQTAFVPDEYWQSVEVAHNNVYKRGYLSWEWEEGLRSFFHPGIFVTIFKILNFLSLDHSLNLIIWLPKVFQALLSAFADYSLYSFAALRFGHYTAKYTELFQLSNWFWWYCAPRTLINTFETSLFTIGLYFYQGFNEDKTKCYRMHLIYIIIAVFLSLIRPTSFICWIWFVISDLLISLKNKQFIKLFSIYFAASVCMILLTLYVDYLFYNTLMFPPFNFFMFNFATNKSDIFGTHPWHWYITQGLWVVLGPKYILMLIFVYLWRGDTIKLTKNQNLIIKVFMLSFCSNIVIYSLLGHKEFRFILAIVPLVSLISAITIQSLKQSFKNVIISIVFILNIFCAFYFGLVHQRGTLDITNDIRNKISMECKGDLKSCSVLFLMPCHSTPFHSHIHHNVSMKFIECKPNLLQKPDYKTEQEIFYENPQKWLLKHVFVENFGFYASFKERKSLPKYIAMYDSLLPIFSSLKHSNLYSVCSSRFHAHVWEGNASGYVYLMCRKH